MTLAAGRESAHLANAWRDLEVRPFAPDQGVVETVVRALRATGRTALRDVIVEIYPDSVVLYGRVPSYYEKQLAQATAQQVVTARRVFSEIDVVCGPYRDSRGIDTNTLYPGR